MSSGVAPTVVRVEREAWAMGTRLRMVAEGENRQDVRAATERALAEVERFDRLLSTWDPDSELSRVNHAPPGLAVAVSPEVPRLLEEVEAWAVRTGRAFDPTVGALVDAWDLRGSGVAPDADVLAYALARTGSGIVEVRPDGVVRHAVGGWIDSGAFGKGAALRSVAESFAPATARRMLVDLGGQIWAGAPADAAWEVDVAHPARRTEPVARLRIDGVSVATSGASERPGHLLDPRTGHPLPHWGSVTVVSDDPLEADVLSTALYVMGPRDGLVWASARRSLAVLFLELAGDEEVVASWTDAMERWLIAAPSVPRSPHPSASIDTPETRKDPT